MDLVHEEHVALLEVREDRGEVAGAVERRAGGGLEPDAELIGDDARERRLAEAGWAGEQEVVDGLPPGARPVDEEAELFLDAFLADELRERLRPERSIERALLLGEIAGEIGRSHV